MQLESKAFWSGETLATALEPLIKPFEPDRVDCAAYTLAMGREYYVSPSDQTVDPQSISIRTLADGEAFTIPPGQFAFLLSEESVKVPTYALAFISIKARVKWRGLINVSGFHVDPGFEGKLIFAVFNAGPVPVHLRQGQPLFLIWYASLDQDSKHVRSSPVQDHIPAELITGIAGELQSLPGVNRKIRDLDTAVTEKVHKLEREQTYYRFLGAIALAMIAAMFATWVRDGGISRLASGPPQVTQTPAPTLPPASAPQDTRQTSGPPQNPETPNEQSSAP